MLRFNNLTHNVQAIIVAIFILTMIVSIYGVFIGNNQQKILVFIIVFGNIFITGNLTANLHFKYISFVSNLNIIVLIIYLILVYLYILYLQKVYLMTSKNMITTNSIKVALDTLPIGIAFFNIDSLLVFRNYQINDINLNLFDYPLKNYVEFIDDIKNSKFIKQVDKDNYLVLKNQDLIWQYNLSEIKISKTTYYQVICFDVTSLYQHSKQLQLENNKINDYLNNLKTLLLDIKNISKDQNLLDFKVNIHNELGRATLATRKYLSNELSGDIKFILELWNDVINNILLINHDSKNNLYQKLNKISLMLGCKINLKGKLPKNYQKKYIVVSMIREGVINAIRHGFATEVFVDIKKNNDKYNIVLTDNGKGCSRDIVMSGGLKLIEKQISQLNGHFFVSCDQKVILEAEV